MTKKLSNIILALEKKTTTAISIYNLLSQLKMIIENRKNNNVFGPKFDELLKEHSNETRIQFEEKCIEVYDKSLLYLNQWFDFENSIFKNLGALNLHLIDALQYDKIKQVAKDLKLKVDEVILSDEICLINEIIKNNVFNKNESQDKLWCKLLKDNRFPEMQKIIEIVMAIPVSNSYTERVFSIMKNLMTEERNQLDINSIKAEICIKMNFSMDLKNG